MWRITKLTLENFVYIKSGLQQNSVTIDLSESSNMLNVFLGKMGTGKSAILGHLQPFATYGTLDSRNQESMILAGETGRKEIVFERRDTGYVTEYIITHDYHPTKTGHTTKSYVMKNGLEMNENGNTSSFKAFIKDEFGIDQSFLRLLRLGPNVANFIEMKATERKTFIATLMEDTEVYLTIHNKISEEHRQVAGVCKMLSDKLYGTNAKNEEQLKENLQTMQENLNELTDNIERNRSSISMLLGANMALLNGMSIGDYGSYVNELQYGLNNIQADINTTKLKLVEYQSIDTNEVSSNLVEATVLKNAADENIVKLQMKLNNITGELDSMVDIGKVRESVSYMDSLRSANKQLEESLERDRIKLIDSTYHYSYSFLTSFPTTIDDFTYQLNEMLANHVETIERIYDANEGTVKNAAKKFDIISKRIDKLNATESNIGYANNVYVQDGPLFIPEGCPGNCPYFNTHPSQYQTTKTEAEEHRMVYLRERDTLIREAEEYSAIIQGYPRMQQLRQVWKTVSKVLKDIGALNSGDLFQILTNSRARTNWYSRTILIEQTELAIIHEEYNNRKMTFIKSSEELMKLESMDNSQVIAKIESLESQKIEVIQELDEMIANRESHTSEMKRLSELMVDASQKSVLADKLEVDEAEYEKLLVKFNESNNNLIEANNNVETISSYQATLNTIESKYTLYNSEVSKLSQEIQDIELTKTSFNEYDENRKILKLIMDSVSSKSGIPVILVKVFLEQCRSIINDLIADVFDDSLELLDFEISESTNEFNMPYVTNGQVVPDVSFASQGQQAIISIAIAFAICRKSMFDYNITLLDEIDNSIHKDDKERFLNILFKQMSAMGADQIFLITHNDIIQTSGVPVTVISTGDKTDNESIRADKVITLKE